MSPEAIGLVGIGGLLMLLVIGMPVAIALMVVGTLGLASLAGWPAALALLANESFEVSSFYPLSVIPLFVLMGNIAARAGLSRDLYDAAYAMIGHYRGGLASATLVGCAGFSAVSGSSVASAVTMGRVALPEMARFGYAPRLATGAVAAGGTLGILIPPSTGFVLYAVLTETSIGRLFMAGVIPGLVLAGLFIATVAVLTRRDPALGPPGPRPRSGARRAALVRALPLAAIVGVTIGGLYMGAFTPVEASGIGAFLALAVALARRALPVAVLAPVLLASVRTTAMVFLIVIGAHVFGPFLALTGLPAALTRGVVGLDLGATGTLVTILALFVLLGTFLEGLAMLVTTLPLVFPIVTTMGFDPIWFGVLMVITLEMGLITPPVGVNVFVVKGLAGGVPMAEIFKGIAPFWLAMVACLALLVAFPDLSLMLPRTMFG